MSPTPTPPSLAREAASLLAQYRAAILRGFTYHLNAMEKAAQTEHPAQHGYAEKRRAVLEYVESLVADLYPEVPR